MKAFFTTLVIFCLVSSLPPVVTAQALVDEGAQAEPRFSQEEISELVAPIALYPDPLVALILPASTFPSDVVLASRFLDSGADIAQADEKPWDSSVVGLVRYPATLKWMDENLEWTTQLGDAYLSQPDDVMDAIQQLRAQAASVGNLVDTPQQTVVEDDSYIRIVPADPEYIYVPYYDPEVVYYERPVTVPLLTFSVGCEVGPWLRYDFDWHHRRLYCGEWHQGWDYRRDHDRDGRVGDHAFINRQLTNSRVWHGDPGRRLASARLFSQTRIAHERDRSIALPEHFAERSQRRDSITGNPNASRSPSSARTSPDFIRRDPNSRDRFVMPNTPAPSIAGNGKHHDDSFRGGPASRNAGDSKSNNAEVPRALPFRGEGNDRVSPGRMPQVPSVVRNSTHDEDRFRRDPQSRNAGEDNNGNVPHALPFRGEGSDPVATNRMPRVPSVVGSSTHESDKFRGDPRAASRDSDAARIAAAAAAARARTDVIRPHDNPPVSSRRDFTPQVGPQAQQVSPIHPDVPRSPVMPPPFVRQSNPVITGHAEHSTPQIRPLPQAPPQQPQMAPQIHRPDVAARIQQSIPQARVAPPVQRIAPQAPMAAHVQPSAPPQVHLAPQVQRVAPAMPAPQDRSGPPHGGGSGSSSNGNDDGHHKRGH